MGIDWDDWDDVEYDDDLIVGDLVILNNNVYKRSVSSSKKFDMIKISSSRMVNRILGSSGSKYLKIIKVKHINGMKYIKLRNKWPYYDSSYFKRYYH